MRIKGRIALIIMNLAEDWLHHVIIMISVALITVVSLYALQEYKEYHSIFEWFDKTGLTDKAVVYTNLDYNYFSTGDITAPRELLENISEIDAVGKATYVNDFIELGTSADSSNIYLYDYYALGDCDYPFIITEGRAPKIANEVVLSDRYRDEFDLNETIHADIFDQFSRNDEGEYYVDPSLAAGSTIGITLTVVGFCKEDTPVVRFGHREYPSTLTERFTAFDDFADGINLAMGCEFVCDDQTPIRSSMYGALILEPAEGYTADDIVSEYNFDNTDIVSYSEQKSNYEELFAAVRSRVYEYIILAVAVCMTNMVTAFLLRFKSKKTETVVSYICGADWRELLIIYAATYIPAIILGVFTGVASLLKFGNEWLKFETGFYYRNSMILLLVEILVSALLMTPIVFANVRKSPIEMIRQE